MSENRINNHETLNPNTFCYACPVRIISTFLMRADTSSGPRANPYAGRARKTNLHILCRASLCGMGQLALPSLQSNLAMCVDNDCRELWKQMNKKIFRNGNIDHIEIFMVAQQLKVWSWVIAKIRFNVFFLL